MRPLAAAPYFLLTVAAFMTSGGPNHNNPRTATRTFSDAAPTTATSSNNNNNNQDPKDPSNPCPFYGCPLHPQDVHYNTDALKAILETMRELPAEKVTAETLAGDDQSKEWNRRDAATLTLIGYKGGPLLDQVNQDRAMVISPFTPEAHDDENKENIVKESSNTKTETTADTTSRLHQQRILLGVFDGHASRGEIVSEYTVQTLPATLAHKLATLPDEPTARQNATVQALHESFVEMDTTAPADPSGGCTATVILRQDQKVYIANAGDSRSFLVAYRPSTKQVQIVYISREDKPSLPDEKARVEAMGGQVYIPLRGTSRVVYHDPITGAPSGLAMSRSIGDWAAGKLGVIPDPIVEVVDIPQLVDAILRNDTEKCYVVDENGDMDEGACGDRSSPEEQKDDVYLFGVSATDGLMDYLAAQEIAKVLAASLFDKGASHPVTACELLIFSAANGWQQDKQGRYRDDIAIAVSALRFPGETEDA